MQLSKIRLALAATLTTALLLGGAISAHAQLIVDGGFEPPNPTTTPGLFQSGYVVKNVGDSFGGPSDNAWKVVQLGGGAANIAITSTTEWTNFPQPKTYFNASSDLQWLDLTGTTDNGAKVGVEQVIATTPATQYRLSFSIGSFNGAVTPIEVFLNSGSVGTFTNSTASTFPTFNGDGVAGNTWQQFTYDFTASSSATTLTFYNLASGPASGLDDVSVTALTATAPEPGTLALLALGGTLVLARRRR